MVFGAFAEFLMVLHKGLFVVFLMRQVEEQPGLERAFVLGLGGLSFGIIIQTQCIVTAGLEDMVVIIIGLPQQFIINIDGLAILTHVEVAVCEPETVFNLNVDVSLAFKKCNCADPVSGFDVVFESGHFLCFDFLAAEVIGGDFGHFGF